MARIVRVVGVVVVAAVAVACTHWAPSPRFGSLQVGSRPFTFRQQMIRFEVKNGAQGAVVTDPRTNLVTIDVRYAIGSAEDPPGKSGMAHLAEHLMQAVRAEPGGPTLSERVSALALELDAYTTPDHTHYHTSTQPNRLGDALALEASRLAAPCDHLDDATFLHERDAVVAEERERATPSAALATMMMADVFGAEHPYARTAVDTEVASITRDEACAFIAAHYAPDRVIVVVTGPLDARFVQHQIGQAFGPILRHSTRRRVAIEPPTLAGTHRHAVDIDGAAAIVMFEGAPWGSDHAVDLRLAGDLLEEVLTRAAAAYPWITGAGVTPVGGKRAGATAAYVSVDDPARLDEAVALIFDEGRRLYDDVEPHTMSRIRGAMRVDYVAGWDQVSTRGDWIANYIQYTDHNEFMVHELAALAHLDDDRLASPFSRRHATTILLTSTGNTERVARLDLTSDRPDDMPPWRTPVAPDEAHRPLAIVSPGLARRVQRFELANGLTVELAPDPRSPIVDARIVFPAGSAQEPPARPGLAWAAAFLLQQELEDRYDDGDRDKITWALDLGAQLSYRVDETTTVFGVRGTNTFSDWHLWRLSWLLDQGLYDPELVAVASQHADPARLDEVGKAELDYRAHLYGEGHPYARPPVPPRAMLAVTAADLDDWRRTRYRVNGATLVVSGGFDAAAIEKTVEELFGPLPAEPPPTTAPVPSPSPEPGILAVHTAGARQVRTRIGFTSTSSADGQRAAREVLETMVDDRVRLVRGPAGSSDGIHARYWTRAAGSVLEIDGLFEPDQVVAAVPRILTELATLRAAGDGFTDDFVRARRRVMARIVAQTGSAQAIAAELVDLATAGGTAGDRDTLAAAIASLTPEDVAAVAAADLDPARMVVQLVGPAAAVDATVGVINSAPPAAAAE